MINKLKKDKLLLIVGEGGTQEILSATLSMI